MFDLPYANNIEKFKYLKPPKALIKKAYSKLIKYKKNRKYTPEKYIYFRYVTLKRKAIMAYEFILYTKTQTAEPVFELTEVIDFKKRNILISEKKVSAPIAGWLYRPTYHYYLYAYHEDSKRDLSNSLRYAHICIIDPKIKDLKINDYLTISVGHMWLEDVQKILNKKPEEVEYLYKNGYKELLPKKIAPKYFEFLKKFNKDLNDPSLEQMRNYYKVWKSYDEKKNIQQIKEIFKIYYDYNIEKYSIKEIKRVINLIDTGTTKDHLENFTKACEKLNLKRHKEIFKGKSIRDAIIKEYNLEIEAEKAEKERQRLERRRREIQKEKKEKEIKRIAKQTLEETTKHFKHFEIENFIFKPLRTIKDFTEVSNKLNLCLMQNEYYIKIKQDNQLIYLVTPKDKNIKESEVVQFYNKQGKISVGQISAIRNTKSENHDIIKKIAEQLTVEDLINV